MKDLGEIIVCSSGSHVLTSRKDERLFSIMQ